MFVFVVRTKNIRCKNYLFFLFLFSKKNIDGVGIRVHLVERTNESLTLKLLVFISPKSGDCRINSDACLLTVNDKLNDTTTRVRAKRGQSSILTEGEESKRCTNATLKGGDYVLMQVTFESPLIGEGKSAEGIIGIDVPIKMPILYALQFRETGR